jgi:histidinol-phosphatase
MYEEELGFADALAEEAAEIALSLFGTDLEVRTKQDRTPVTEADVGVERMIRARLAERFPELQPKAETRDEVLLAVGNTCPISVLIGGEGGRVHYV